ncbi:tetratricopeptide repeat protein [Psychromonas sp. Urea-02u-13]|uniref:tetratricopeptide repeat protein n=1 Tax=Psychromonas sp. Urea-02u-13 TaxID=2058326 RepID=UPI000C346B74|nr:hypothetical protein [Psychromonas sp. Urea-02u-13]PKG38762.1 hypothetical protein CXF74_11730 [Psychromonas sp. Urea-02u-13]
MHAYIQKIFTVLILTSSFFSITCWANEQSDTQEMLDRVDKVHQDFTQKFYRDLLKDPIYKTKKYSSISALLKQLNDTQEIKNTALIINNMNMIKRYYDDPAIFILIKKLLKVNAYHAAKTLINEVTEQGDTSLATHANFLLADFYFQRRQWKKVLKNLTTEINFLENQKYHSALLMRGISFQKMNEHYLAIKEYEKVPNDSTYYTSSQLNLAIANLRQGWWTDAHIIIQKQLNVQKKSPHEATLNRLYVTLAYSLLNQGYYRTARTTFHQVGSNSKYANQAILGIALTAAQQGDDIGALNATRYLKKQLHDELPVHESYLLMPFFYEKSNQLVAASTGYTQAETYYKKKINDLKKRLNAPLDLSLSLITADTNFTASLAENTLSFTPYYPNYYFKNRSLIGKYQSYIEKNTLQKQYKDLSDTYQQTTNEMGKVLLQHKIDNLTSYLDQSRYGLARLFDNNTAEQ